MCKQISKAWISTFRTVALYFVLAMLTKGYSSASQDSMLARSDSLATKCLRFSCFPAVCSAQPTQYHHLPETPAKGFPTLIMRVFACSGFHPWINPEHLTDMPYTKPNRLIPRFCFHILSCCGTPTVEHHRPTSWLAALSVGCATACAART